MSTDHRELCYIAITDTGLAEQIGSVVREGLLLLMINKHGKTIMQYSFGTLCTCELMEQTENGCFDFSAHNLLESQPTVEMYCLTQTLTELMKLGSL